MYKEGDLFPMANYTLQKHQNFRPVLLFPRSPFYSMSDLANIQLMERLF